MQTHTISIADDLLENMITESVQSVIQTMLATEASFKGSINYPHASGQPVADPIQTEETIVAGSVGFAGEANGIIYLYMEESLSSKLTGKMLGMSDEEVLEGGQDTINDVIGELANMTVGSFKNKLCDMGHNCRLTIPSVLKGKQFTVQSIPSNDANIIRKFFRFDIEGSPYIVDLLFQIN